MKTPSRRLVHMLAVGMIALRAVTARCEASTVAGHRCSRRGWPYCWQHRQKAPWRNEEVGE